MGYEDLTGRIFENLKVVGQADDYVVPEGRKNAGKHERMWKCECLLCGDTVTTRERSLKTGHIKSCGRKHRSLVSDLSGREFGDLKVVERASNKRAADGTTYVMYKCSCKCGNTLVTRASALTSGNTTSCGICSRSRSNMGKGLIDITGKRFDFWEVIEKSRTIVEPRGRKVILWKCRCKCGEIRELKAGTLKGGLSLSCGCHKMEVLREKALHGFGISRAEKFVSDWLSAEGFYYEPQKVYPDLRGASGYPLSYDFLVYSGIEPAFLIECQGRQHYEPVEYFGGVERFVIQCENDRTKRDYASKLGLSLLELSYTYSNDDIIKSLQQCLIENQVQKGQFSYEVPVKP